MASYAMKCFLRGIRNIARQSLPFYQRFLPWRYTVIIHGNQTKSGRRGLAETLKESGFSNCSVVESHKVFDGRNELILDLGYGTSTAMAFGERRLMEYEFEAYGNSDLFIAIKEFIKDKYSCAISIRKAASLAYSEENSMHEFMARNIEDQAPMPYMIPVCVIQKVIDSHNAAIRRLTRRLLNKCGNSSFSKIILTGDGAYQKGLKEALTKAFGLPVEIAPNAEVFPLECCGNC